MADMANVTAKVVVESAKQGEVSSAIKFDDTCAAQMLTIPSQTHLQDVLGLPLTEDAYLKYSNELAFAYYRNVMVGS